MNPSGLYVIFCTVPSHKAGEEISTALLDARLAACINILPGITSHYWWQEKKEVSSEVLLLIKCPVEKYQLVESTIQAHHPYEVPEIVALSAEKVSPQYLQWALKETSSF